MNPGLGGDDDVARGVGDGGGGVGLVDPVGLASETGRNHFDHLTQYGLMLRMTCLVLGSQHQGVEAVGARKRTLGELMSES